jgi:Tfp pilus assembly protein PilN
MTEQLIDTQVDGEVDTPPGKPAPVRISWAPIPKVNLLPMEILEKRKFRRLQLMLGGAVVGAVVIAAGGMILAQRQVEEANDELLLAQAKVAALRSEEARYAAVPKVIKMVDEAIAARTLAMGSDVLWYRYLSDIDGARPRGVELTGLTLNIGGTAAGPVIGDVLSQIGPGSISVQGTAEEYAQVSSWLEATDKVTGFESPKLTDAADDGESVTFGSTAVITTDALSGRYHEKAD